MNEAQHHPARIDGLRFTSPILPCLHTYFAGAVGWVSVA
jgi:hypothetical protein